MCRGMDNSKYVCIKNGLRGITLKAHHIATFLKIENCIHWLRKIYGFLDIVSKKIVLKVYIVSIVLITYFYLLAVWKERAKLLKQCLPLVNEWYGVFSLYAL